MTNANKQWMIYGATGYTGELIAREAVKQGLKPVLAGRSAGKLTALAQELGLQTRIFSLGKAQEVAGHLDGYALLLNCAGPFSATAPTMIEACIQSGTHYLDITGEISVFEHAFTQHWMANEADVVLCPGVGFDVIPTDCVAAFLKDALPDATHLVLGFDSRSGMSPGTAKTSIESLGEGGKIRSGGVITSVPLAHGVRRIDFGKGKKLAMTIPWGDVSTAWFTTGIPNIEVYIPSSSKMIKRLRQIDMARPLLGFWPVQKLLKALIGQRVTGPDAQKREKMPTHVWGQAVNAEGDLRTARITTANGYTVTIFGSLEVAKHLLGNTVKGGTYTPSKLMGKELILRLPGSGELTMIPPG